jgi:hypothetical protein
MGANGYKIAVANTLYLHAISGVNGKKMSNKRCFCVPLVSEDKLTENQSYERPLSVLWSVLTALASLPYTMGIICKTALRFNYVVLARSVVCLQEEKLDCKEENTGGGGGEPYFAI